MFLKDVILKKMKKNITFILPLLLLLLLNSCKKELSVSPDELYPSKNGVIISSNPDGAKIYINGKNTGYVTPDTVFWVESGSILITLKKELFKDSSLVVRVGEKDTARVFMDFASNPTMFGKLYIDSNPRGGAIFLNDSALNKTTPATLTGIVPGYYDVTVKVPGYWDETKNIPIRSVVTTYVDAQLVDTLVWINYNSERTPIPSDYLSSIAIERGYIKWVGSLDSGLFSYDDNTWTVYNTDNSILPDNTINSVGVDYFGNLWVCTNYGVVKKMAITGLFTILRTRGFLMIKY
jgi:hypothetical protein